MCIQLMHSYGINFIKGGIISFLVKIIFEYYILLLNVCVIEWENFSSKFPKDRFISQIFQRLPLFTFEYTLHSKSLCIQNY